MNIIINKTGWMYLKKWLIEVCYQKCGDQRADRNYSIFKWSYFLKFSPIWCTYSSWGIRYFINIYILYSDPDNSQALPFCHALLNLLKSYRINSLEWLLSHSWFGLIVRPLLLCSRESILRSHWDFSPTPSRSQYGNCCHPSIAHYWPGNYYALSLFLIPSLCVKHYYLCFINDRLKPQKG